MNNKGLNMYDNQNEDDCKSKLNILIRNLISISNDLREGKCNKFHVKKYLRNLNYNKDTILFFINLVMDTITDQNIDEDTLNNESLDFIIDLKGNIDINDAAGKKLVINQIRNAFAHKSGKIIFFDDKGIKKVRIDNKGWFSIEADLIKLNELFQKIIVIDNNNEANVAMSDLYKSVMNSSYYRITENMTVLLMLNLLMCYNKESIFDQFMSKQVSFIDASKFIVNISANEKLINQHIKSRFFEKYKVLFNSQEDFDSYNAEWKDIIDINVLTNLFSNSYIYDINNMPVDIQTGKHIPVPFLLNYLRNANCHGRIKFEDDSIVFYDKEKDDAQPFFFMKIKMKDLMEFISNDFFFESTSTSVNEHKNKYQNSLYLLEQVKSINSFDNYFKTYKNRFPNMSENDLLKYMYDNNKFSYYLLECPEQTEEFLNYTLSDGRNLYDTLCEFSILDKDMIHNFDMEEESNQYLLKTLLSLGAKLQKDMLSADIEYLERKMKDYHYDTKRLNTFITGYYYFINNLKNVTANKEIDNDETINDYEDIMDLSNDYSYSSLLMFNSKLLEKVSIESALGYLRCDEGALIRFACSYNKSLETDNKKNAIYNINNITRHNSLYKLYYETIENPHNKNKKEKMILYSIVFTNISLTFALAGLGIFTVSKNNELLQDFVKLYVTSMWLLGLSNVALIINGKNPILTEIEGDHILRGEKMAKKAEEEYLYENSGHNRTRKQ